MLATANKKEINELRKASGINEDNVQIPTLEKGTIVRVLTIKGNVYLFEILSPAAFEAEVMRCASHPGPYQFSYYGVNHVAGVFRVGEKIWFGNNRSPGLTSCAKRITVLKPPR